VWLLHALAWVWVTKGRGGVAGCGGYVHGQLLLKVIHVTGAPASQVDLQRAKLPQTRAKGEYEMENTIKVLQHKESKLSGESMWARIGARKESRMYRINRLEIAVLILHAGPCLGLLPTPYMLAPGRVRAHSAPSLSLVTACRQSFKEHEALVYHQLTNLIRDTVWLKSYLSAGERAYVIGLRMIICV
jgi:hypothetical protein